MLEREADKLAGEHLFLSMNGIEPLPDLLAQPDQSTIWPTS